MSVATGRLHDRIEARVRSISNEFDEFSNNITSRMDLAHSRLTTFEETIATKSGKVSVTRKSISNQGGFFDISSRTRHSLRIRKDGIVYPPKAIIPVEPGAEALMPAVTTVSVRDPTPRSLLV
jgi:phage-related protein